MLAHHPQFLRSLIHHPLPNRIVNNMYSVLALHKFCVQDIILEHPNSGVILTGHRSRNRGGLGDRPTIITLYLGRHYLPFYRYNKHLGLDVNIKNARVRARAEVSFGRYNLWRWSLSPWFVIGWYQ